MNTPIHRKKAPVYSPEPVHTIKFAELCQQTNKRLRNSLVFLFLWLIPLAQATAQKVALVLSGGGAKGLAHIGVLKAFDEHHIPVDYIVGTSMGAVVGALYASGYTAKEIEEVALSPYLQEWSQGNLPSKYRYYFTRKQDNASWLSLKVSLDSLATIINPNIVNDDPVNMLLAELFARSSYLSKGNFDSLMIPFRCMAADIFTQQKVMFSRGDLVDAVRASMSVPLFLQPIKVDNKYLFDGGIYNNFPVDVAQKEFNPDFMIGVNVSGSNFTQYPYHKDEQLLGKVLYYLMISKTDSTLIDSSRGVYIEPNLSNYNALEFLRVEEMIKIGYAFGLAKIKEIKRKLARSADSTELAERRNHFRLSGEELRVARVNVRGAKYYQMRYANRMFRLKRKNAYMSLDDLKKGYYKLAGDENFVVSYPKLVYNPVSRYYDFNVNVEQDRNLQVDLGGNFTSRSINQLFVGFQYNYVNRLSFNIMANIYSGRFYQSAQLKTRINFPVFKPFYIEPEVTFNNWDYFKTSDIINIDQRKPTYIEQIDRKFALNVAFPLGRMFKYEMGAGYIMNTDEYNNSSNLASGDLLDVTSFSALALNAGINSNTLNRKMYASEGGFTSLSAKWVNGEETHRPGTSSIAMLKDTLKQRHRWLRLKFTHEQYFGTKVFRWGYMVEAVLSNQPFFRTYTSTYINAPAFYPLQDSRTIMLVNFRAFNYVAGGLRNILRFRKKIDLRLEAYLFQPFNKIIEDPVLRPSFGRDFSSSYFAGMVSLVWHSPVGPVSLSGNYYEDPKKELGVLFHIGYLIFNQRSLD